MKARQIRQLQDNLQRRLRSEYQTLYNQKCKNIQNMLQTKYLTLKEHIQLVYKQIKSDEVFITMLKDRTTLAHISERVEEVFSEVITHERQLIFKKLGVQITNLKFQNQQLRRQNQKLKDSNSNLQKDFTTERQSLQKKKVSTNEELGKVKEQLAFWKNKFDKIEDENKELKIIVGTFKQTYENTQRQNDLKNQYKLQILHMESTIQDLRNRLKESQQRFDKKYQSKKKEFQQKIASYKTVITQMNNERLQTQEAARRAQEENANIYMEKKMLALMKENERKISDIKSAKQRQKSQMERAYELKMKQMQSYFEKLLEHKIHEIEENTGVYFQKMKQEGTNLQRHLEHYEQHYVPVSQYEQQIAKRDQIMMLMKNKLQQFQEMSEENIRKEQILNNKLKDSDIIISSHKQKYNQLEELNQQLIAKVKSYQQANNIFKIGEQKSKDQFLDYERLIKKTKEENEDLKQSFIKLQHQKNLIESQQREKQRKTKDLLQQNEILMKKIKKLNENNEDLIKKKEEYSFTISELKKEITSLEYKLRDKQMTSNLNVTSWQNKINALQQDLKEKGKLLIDLQEKYQQINTIYQQEKKKNYELQNGIKKYQMESKFYKQAGEMQRNQSHSAVEQYKKVINDKNQKINQLQSQIQKKNIKINELAAELRHEKEKAGNQNRKMLLKIKKMSKLAFYQLQNLRKQNNSIIQYLKSCLTIMRNDQSIFKSTFKKELIHLQMNHQHEKQKAIKMIKNEMDQMTDDRIKKMKSEFQCKMKEIYQKVDLQKNQLKRQNKDKEIKIQELNKQQKRLLNQLKKQSEEVAKLQKECQMSEKKLQKQKESFQGKLRQLVREFKQEKDLIVKQYEDKKYIMEQQITTLANNLKRLKLQAQNIQVKHEEQKASINSQLRTIKEQEQVIQKVVYQKDLQIQRIIKDYQASLQTKRLLQNQNRGYSQTLNKKMQSFHQVELRNQQLVGDLNLTKSKYQLLAEENDQLKRKLTQKQDQLQQNLRMRSKFESQLKDIRGALSRSHKNNQLRSLNQLSIQTLQLSNKVNEMRKVGQLLQSKTSLRS